jgi:hypothetical protein
MESEGVIEQGKLWLVVEANSNGALVAGDNADGGEGGQLRFALRIDIDSIASLHDFQSVAFALR